jgi:hypothetical protein
MEVGFACQAYIPDIDLNKHHPRHFPEPHYEQEQTNGNHIGVLGDDATEQKRKKPMQEMQSPQDRQRQPMEDEAN